MKAVCLELYVVQAIVVSFQFVCFFCYMGVMVDMIFVYVNKVVIIVLI